MILIFFSVVIIYNIYVFYAFSNLQNKSEKHSNYKNVIPQRIQNVTTCQLKKNLQLIHTNHCNRAYNSTLQYSQVQIYPEFL